MSVSMPHAKHCLKEKLSTVKSSRLIRAKKVTDNCSFRGTHTHPHTYPYEQEFYQLPEDDLERENSLQCI